MHGREYSRSVADLQYQGFFPLPLLPWARASRSRINWERTSAAAVFSMCVILQRRWLQPGRAITYSHIGQLPNWETTICLPGRAAPLLLRPYNAVLTIGLLCYTAAPHKGAATALVLCRLLPPSAMLLG